MGNRSRRLVLSPQAKFDLIDTARSYESTRPGLGAAFLRRFDETVALIHEFPESAAPLDHEFRRAVIRRFPFCVVYRTKTDVTEILGVLHTRSDPLRLSALMGAA